MVIMGRSLDLLFALIVLLCLKCNCYGSVYDKLSYFEVISPGESDVRERRSARQGAPDLVGRDFSFRAFNLTFNCHLKPRKDLFSPGFVLKVYGADGIPHVQNLQQDNLVFIGQCDGDPDSKIRGVFKGKLFSGSVTYNGQVYGLEDAKQHMTIPKSKASHDEHIMVYKASDMKWFDGLAKNGHGPAFCGNTHEAHDDIDDDDDDDEVTVDGFVPVGSNQHGRHKRATVPSWNTCHIVAVADYKFFQATGRNDVYDTALYIANVMDRVDDIYRSTRWNTGSSITGLGFEITEMRIYKDPLPSGFNMNFDGWQPLNLLQIFSREDGLSEFCAAHLFTHNAFTGNVLGLAYIAPSRSGDLGGICSRSQIMEGSETSLNTGWSSTLNGNNQQVLLQQSYLVTAHELGHNWGSEHDPESGGCAPSGLFSDGKYLMYPYSVAGYDSNNFKFSSCSRKYVSKVLKAKGSSCLKAKVFDENAVCGNGRVDVSEGESCDAGFLGRFNLDECCNVQCEFKGNSVCSPVNKECCLGCQPSPIGSLCRGETGVDCKENSYCDGTSMDCPASSNKEDGTFCLDNGQCKDGICQPFCEYRNLTSCACTDVASSCLRCCRESGSGECKPINGSDILPDGRPCVAGACEAGVCTSTSVSTISRLFDILENLTLDDVVEFFRNNIVGVVIVFSLVLWIPLSILVTYLDYRQKNKLNRSDTIEIRMNRDLLTDEDKRRIEDIPQSSHHSYGTSPRYRNPHFTDLGGFGSASDA